MDVLSYRRLVDRSSLALEYFLFCFPIYPLHFYVGLLLRLLRIRWDWFYHLINQGYIFLDIYPLGVKLILVIIFILIGFLPLYLAEVNLTEFPRLILLIILTEVYQMLGIFQLALSSGGDLLGTSVV